MYTANTMAVAIEALGMSLPYSSSNPANSQEKVDECFAAGAAIHGLLASDLRPSAIMTAPAFRNAIVTVMALGGSTNAVLHLIAMARSVGVALDLEDFQKVSDAVPFIADLKPSGRCGRRANSDHAPPAAAALQRARAAVSGCDCRRLPAAALPPGPLAEKASPQRRPRQPSPDPSAEGAAPLQPCVPRHRPTRR